MSLEPEGIHADLATLADGTLPAGRREQLLAQVADSPDMAAELERQRRAVAIVRSLGSVEAPPLLRRSIETLAGGEEEHASARSTGASRRRRSVPLRLQAGAAVALAAAAVAAVTVALTTGGPSAPTAAPTLLQASSLALRPSARAAPAESSSNDRLLAASAAGIPYPYWGGRLGWQATGARTDALAGRTVTTVFYTHGARRIGYSIVSGSALPVPAPSATIGRHGVSFHVVRAAGATVVTWREAGHTCILTARAVAPGTLVRLAAWERA